MLNLLKELTVRTYFQITIINGPELVSQDINITDKSEAYNAASRLKFILRFAPDYEVILNEVVEIPMFDDDGEFIDSKTTYTEVETW
jgi:hypothetical protein